jgi:hypothetical protein
MEVSARSSAVADVSRSTTGSISENHIRSNERKTPSNNISTTGTESSNDHTV